MRKEDWLFKDMPIPWVSDWADMPALIHSFSLNRTLEMEFSLRLHEWYTKFKYEVLPDVLEDRLSVLV